MASTVTDIFMSQAGGCKSRVGDIEGITPDYSHHGTATPFAALDTLDGKVITVCKPRHRHQEFRVRASLVSEDPRLPGPAARREWKDRAFVQPRGDPYLRAAD